MANPNDMSPKPYADPSKKAIHLTLEGASLITARSSGIVKNPTIKGVISQAKSEKTSQ